MSNDYLNTFKDEYTFKDRGSFSKVTHYLIQRMINFTLKKFGALAIAKGISKVELGGAALFDIFFTFSSTSKVPWHLISKYLNLPWLLGGFVTNYLIQKVNSYIAKEDMISNLKNIEEQLEANRLAIVN
mmetsp:Transcript_57244/g.79405  ORF Transcript_57244/g.79405 Transcript_57244/m.79405 type:complete len:129 (-) Transcript_57244:327-713(-)